MVKLEFSDTARSISSCLRSIRRLISQIDRFRRLRAFDAHRSRCYAGESESMKITDLRTRIVHLGFRNCVLVAIETDAGITGISETVMKRRTLTIEQSILQLRRYLIGRDPTEIEDHWEKMYRDSFWVGGAMHATAISAVDCALWDILGKSLSVPVHKLMAGPTRRHAPVYCHCPSGTTPEAFAANLKTCKARGYHSA